MIDEYPVEASCEAIQHSNRPASLPHAYARTNWNSYPLTTSRLPSHYVCRHTRSTVAEEKRYNPRLTKTRAEFISIMSGLHLAAPENIEIAVPANMRDGAPEPTVSTVVGDATATAAT